MTIQCLDLRKRSVGSHETNAIPRATVALVMLLMLSSAQSKIETLLENVRKVLVFSERLRPFKSLLV